tara:strand:- start:3802 stop:5484 length:1683 start_codon:yes stop_codon:yes gene_type:complete
MSNKNNITAEFIPDTLDNWVKYTYGTYVIWLSGDNNKEIYNYLIKKLLIKEKVNLNYINKIINNLDDHFGIIIISKKWILAAVDCARTIPIFWKKINNNLILSPQARNIANKYQSKVDENQLIAFQMSGYTIDEGTLWQGINNINPGYYLFYSIESNLYLKKYYFYEPWEFKTQPYDKFKEELKIKIKELLEKLVKKANGRTIAIPLSAGLDSRLVASGLKDLNYVNVKCYSYGLKNNYESRASKIIAKTLGYDWEFVEINQNQAKEYFASLEYKNFISKTVDGCATTTIQGLLALDVLLKRRFLKKEDIIVNGNSGDFITGGHIPHIENIPKKITNINLFLNDLIEKHFDKHYSLWNSLKSEKNKKVIKELLLKQLKKSSYNISDNFMIEGIFEFLEYENRQAKFVNNCQRLFEAYGFNWCLPLWDKSFMTFWSSVPLKYKFNQKLYKETLFELNMGKVWGENYNYKYFVSPYWMRIIRFLTKPFFVFLGKNKWHRFEKKYLSYWMDNICGESIFSYLDIIKNKNGARHYISWFTIIAENMNLGKNWQNIDLDYGKKNK